MASKRTGKRLILTVLAAMLACAGCAWEAGQPWGIWHPSVRVRASVPADRQLPDGRFRTASEYLWQIESLQIELADVQLLQATNASQLSFDPAKPPAGYSLCHGGHCHAADGRLVDYAEIQAELLGGGGGVAPVAAPLDVTAAMAAQFGPAVAAAPVDLPLGELATLRLAWRAVHLRARVWDGGPGGNRLPSKGISLTVDLPASSLAAQLTGSAGPHQPVDIHTRADLDVSVAFLDGVDVAALAAAAPIVDGVAQIQQPADAPAAKLLAQAWLHHGALTVAR